MRYVRARIGDLRRDLMCRIYYAEMLRSLAQITSAIGGGEFPVTPLSDLLYPKPEETRTGEEIIEQIRTKLRKESREPDAGGLMENERI